MNGSQLLNDNLRAKFSQKETATPQAFISIGYGCRLNIESTYGLAYESASVALPPKAREVIDSAYQFLKTYVDSRVPIYGINTNFGDQVRYIDTSIKETESLNYYESINERQENILRSLSCGLGNIVAPEIVRVTMMLRAHCIGQGYSGVHPDLVNTLLDFINAGVTPVVRCYGSIGASGDLIPLSMIAAA
ncbi:MAG: aromatic amino acid lyase, partial [Legionella sp.]